MPTWPQHLSYPEFPGNTRKSLSTTQSNYLDGWEGVSGIPLELGVSIGLTVGIGLFTMLALRRETDLPLVVSGMFVPVVVVVGFGSAFLVQDLFGLSLIESLGLLGVALFWLTSLYELNYSPVVR